MWYPFVYYGSLVVLIPGILFSIFAQIWIKIAYSKYSKVEARAGVTAENVSRTILDKNECYGVQIKQISGNLTDNYDPKTDVLSLSESVYGKSSVAAIGVAAHECGHACQQHEGSFMMRLRSVLVPVTNIGTRLAVPIAILGLFIELATVRGGFGTYLIVLGVILYSLSTVFAFVTLPVEINASQRAVKMLKNEGVLEREEMRAAKKVLFAAAMTYVAALLMSLLYLLRFLIIISSSRKRKN